MSWRNAPLYVEVHDLARWLLERTARWAERDQADLGRAVGVAACDLACQVSLALTFPATRRQHLEDADHDLVRLRELLRLGRDLGVLSAGGLRFSAGRMRAVGRMIGGWRKRVDATRPVAIHRPVTAATDSGDGPPAAITA
jgi:hypothetical protein